MPFNESKCKDLHFESRNPNISYILNDVELKSVDREKGIGILIDDKLKFHRHSAAATKKGNQMLGILKRSYISRDAFTIITLYKAVVRPHLEYGNIIWGPSSIGDINKVESI